MASRVYGPVDNLLWRVGQTAAAAELYGNWTASWDRFGWLPEQFDMTMSTVHPIEKVLSHSLAVLPCKRVSVNCAAQNPLDIICGSHCAS